jgi:hypothetical protein
MYSQEKIFFAHKKQLIFSESGSVAVLLQIPYFVNAAAREGTFIYLIITAVSRAVWLPTNRKLLDPDPEKRMELSELPKYLEDKWIR